MKIALKQLRLKVHCATSNLLSERFRRSTTTLPFLHKLRYLANYHAIPAHIIYVRFVPSNKQGVTGALRATLLIVNISKVIR